MVYTETTRTGYFGRVGNAITGVIFGLIFFFASFILLFWNEGRAVHTARTLEEGQSAVVSIDSAKIDPANEGKLVHFTAKAINPTGVKLVDPMFGVSQDAIHLKRSVSMYQWKEDKHTESHKEAVGGGQSDTTTYSYSKVWDTKRIDSTNFKEQGHVNPTNWRIEGATFDAPTVTAGAFTLDNALADKIDDYTPVTLSSGVVSGLSADLKSDTIFVDAYNGDELLIPNDPGRKADSNNSQIGDLHVAFDVALPGDVSVIARQSGSALAPYQTKNNPIEFLYVGNHTAAEMFKAEEAANSKLTWILRAVGFVAMWIGMALMLNPLKVLSDVIGIVGDIVGAGIGLFTGVIAIALSFITIAVAWIAYRPIVGIGLLAVAVGAIVLLFVLRSKGAAQRKSVGAPQPAGR